MRMVFILTIALLVSLAASILLADVPSRSLNVASICVLGAVAGYLELRLFIFLVRRYPKKSLLIPVGCVGVVLLVNWYDTWGEADFLAEGKRLQAAIESYKTRLGHYPIFLEEAGIKTDFFVMYSSSDGKRFSLSLFWGAWELDYCQDSTEGYFDKYANQF